MITLATNVTKLLISTIDPLSSSLLQPADEMVVNSYPQIVIEEKLNKFTANQKSYIDDIAIASESKLLINIPLKSTVLTEYIVLQKIIKDYINLEEDWDGYGGIPPMKEIVVTATNLVSKLKMEEIKVPKPMLSGSGEIGLYWKNDSMYIEITIDEPQKYSLYIEEGSSYSGKIDIDIADNLPEELFISLSKFKIV